MRTTTDKVAAILGEHYDGKMDLLPHIETASITVDYVQSEDDKGILDDKRLELIERWLAAHSFGHMDQFYANEGQLGASAGYQGQTEMYFNSTQYGQMAVLLDISGTLAEMQLEAKDGTTRKVGMEWLGTRMRHDHSETSADQGRQPYS